MSFAILRMEKLKGSISGLGKHIDRSSSNGETHVPENVNENRIKNNIHWDKEGTSYTQEEWRKFCEKMPLSNRINSEINSRYKLDKKIRKDAVRGIEYIMTSDNLMMREIFKDENLFKEWVKDNRRFLADIYGEENIVSMHLHLDEKTPHLHAIITPITKDGRLSCKAFVDGKKDLSAQQTKYAELMKKYGMERGQLGSTAKHQRPNTIKNHNHDRRNR